MAVMYEPNTGPVRCKLLPYCRPAEPKKNKL